MDDGFPTGPVSQEHLFHQPCLKSANLLKHGCNNLKTKFLSSVSTQMGFILTALGMQQATTLRAKQTLCSHRDVNVSASRIVQHYSSWI